MAWYSEDDILFVEFEDELEIGFSRLVGTGKKGNNPIISNQNKEETHVTRTP